MKPQEKHAPEDPAGESFYNLSQFSSKPSPHGGGPHSNVSLRQKAEAHFREREALSTEKLDSLSPESMRTILHELRVHQIELEMQNEELRRAKDELDATQARYFDLYDMAPVGYCTVSEMGLILEANLTAATLLRRERDALVGRGLSNFISKEDQELYYRCWKKLLETNQPQECDLRMLTHDGTAFFAHLVITAAQNETGEPVCHVALVDVTTSKRISAVLQARVRISEYAPTHSLGELLTQTLDEAELLTGSTIGFFHFVEADQLTLSLQEWSTNTRQRMCTAEGGGRHYPVDEAGVWADALRECRPVIYNDYASLPHRKGLPPGHSQVVRMLVVPILQDDKVMALLGIGNKPDDYDSEDIEITSQLAGLSWDIAERKRAELSLRKSEERTRHFFEHQTVGMAITSPDKKWLDVNDKLCQTLGYTREEMLQMTWAELTHPDDREANATLFKQLLSGEIDNCNFEKRYVRKDGGVVDTMVSLACVRQNDGNLEHVLLLVVDVTEVKKLENTLGESEVHFRTLADSGQALIWTSGTDKKCNYFNRVWLDFTGRALEQELGDGWAEGVHPDDLDSCFRIYVEAFDRRTPFDMDYRLRRHDGEYRWLQDQGTPRYSSDGEFLGYIGHCLDITDRRQTEELLMESESRYAQLAEQSLTVAWEVDAQGLYTYVSRVSETVWGYRPDELIGRKNFYDLHPESGREEFKASAFTVFARKQPFVNLVNVIQTKDGRQVWVSTNGAPILNAEGTLCGYHGSDTDVTERKLAEAEVRALEDHYRDILQTAMDGFCMVDMQGRIQAVNASYCRMTGYSEEELLNMGVADLEAVMPPEDVASTIQKIIAQGGSRFESRHRGKDGRIIDVEVSVQLRPSDNAMVSFLHDITERKRTEEALLKAHLELEERVKNRTEELNRSNAQLQLLLDSTAEGIYGIDTQGECTFCNPACLRMLGYGREDELLGKNMHWQIHQKHTDGTHFPVEERRIFREFEASEGSHVDDEVLWRADGTSFPAEYWFYPQRIDGVTVGAVVTFIDITQRKRTEAVVLQNVARAEELARLKSRFVSMASHELRTPLANIMLASELLKNFGNAMPAERSQQVLSGLVDIVSSMVQTIDDLLLSGKIEEGNLPFTPARFALLDFLKRCCQEVQPESPSRIEIAFRDAGLNVTADEQLLGHILKNLLENALKYSPDDSKVELGAEAGTGSLTLSVSDRGIGVPEAERKLLFDAFSRASNVGDKPGSGLGLFIAQKCAQAHGGQMRYAPLPDGSHFSATIPLAATEPAKEGGAA